MTTNDTIVAIATPAGKGGIGIVRVSGPAARKILKRWFHPQHGKTEERRAVYGQVIGSDQHVLDTGIGVFFAGPRSYTGEDVAEFQLHGSPIILRELTRWIVDSGAARMAEPGEFTRRAFENNRIDLTQAEQIQLMLDAETRFQLRVANVGTGPLHEQVQELRELVIGSSAAIEAALEYPDEAETADGLDQAMDNMHTCREKLETLISGYRKTAAFNRGIRVVLVGAPNAGKSALFNRIVGADRAIVTELPGTTRDTVEAVLDLDGLRVDLVDTAGVRETVDRVETEGVRRTIQAARGADLVIKVLDGAMPLTPQRKVLADLRGEQVIEVINKVDLMETAPAEQGVSALRGDGIGELVGMIRTSAGDLADEELVLFTDRQSRGAESALKRLVEGIESLNSGAPDLAAAELIAVSRELESILGYVVTDDVLDALFGSFCLGK